MKRHIRTRKEAIFGEEQNSPMCAAFQKNGFNSCTKYPARKPKRKPDVARGMDTFVCYCVVLN